MYYSCHILSCKCEWHHFIHTLYLLYMSKLWHMEIYCVHIYKEFWLLLKLQFTFFFMHRVNI